MTNEVQVWRAAVDEAEQSGRLDRMALALARMYDAAVEPAPHLETLDRYAKRVRVSLTGDEGPAGAIAAINQVLFREAGFAGNERDYYDPRNSYLHEVLGRRTGIPITLAIVFLEVGRRCGFPTVGLNLPLRFMVGWPLRDGHLIVDVFGSGRIVEPGDCTRILSEIAGRSITIEGSHIEVATPRGIARRMLANLLGIFISRERYGDALRANEALATLGLRPELIRDRGLILARLDRLDEAIADLSHYLESMPDAADRASVEQQIDGLRRARPGRERLN
ncbi:MAG: tetratricopeptide repeat protein [Chloroflexi bacterium]|nr:tetratricopeptide repeat protein [Chloroflexota bacterium]